MIVSDKSARDAVTHAVTHAFNPLVNHRMAFDERSLIDETVLEHWLIDD